MSITKNQELIDSTKAFIAKYKTFEKDSSSVKDFIENYQTQESIAQEDILQVFLITQDIGGEEQKVFIATYPTAKGFNKFKKTSETNNKKILDMLVHESFDDSMRLGEAYKIRYYEVVFNKDFTTKGLVKDAKKLQYWHFDKAVKNAIKVYIDERFVATTSMVIFILMSIEVVNLGIPVKLISQQSLMFFTFIVISTVLIILIAMIGICIILLAVIQFVSPLLAMQFSKKKYLKYRFEYLTNKYDTASLYRFMAVIFIPILLLVFFVLMPFVGVNFFKLAAVEYVKNTARIEIVNADVNLTKKEIPILLLGSDGSYIYYREIDNAALSSFKHQKGQCNPEKLMEHTLENKQARQILLSKNIDSLKVDTSYTEARFGDVVCDINSSAKK